jgi:ABC-2 type transport system permease protein
VAIVARKEFADALHSRLFVIVLALLVVLTAISVLVAALVYQGQVDAYEQSVRHLRELGKDPGPAPRLSPLTLLRGMVDYLEIIGAILGIVLGYLTIAREKNRRTLQLLLTRPVSRSELMTGKLIGNAAIISAVLGIVGLLALSGLDVVGRAALSGSELLKMALVLLLSVAYVLTFFCLGAFTTLATRRPSTALMACFVVWLVVVLIIPQVGDTMDPDNQVPGGFFKSMGLTKPQEIQVLSNFSSYERTRDRVEQLSLTKHYERAGFGLLGIKPEFDGRSVGYILDAKRWDVAWVVAPLLLGICADLFIINRRESIYGGQA